MATQTVITTRRLRLRTWRRVDWHAFHVHCNTPDVMEWLGGVATVRRVKQEVDWYVRDQLRHGTTFWLMEKRDKTFVGFCGLITVKETSSTVLGELEIGWRVDSGMWRRGFAYEAASACLKYAFEKLLRERVIARVAPGNIASRKLMEKLGMRRWPQRDYVHPADGLPLIVYAIGRDAMFSPPPISEHRT